ncbi:DNA-directed RNA polymerase II protein [Striga asiatica]|uniref:DNA-directed RNA polymerase II protein n=1 Tax=Striga asiatica TaxID=4170 RepID=A0A5A7Q0Q9_STRAF|nr:DNA-directed RNA polymerase II protein [Striga asiatica]
MEEKINLNGGCDFFSWVDPPTCDRPEKIMPGLVKKMKALERANENFKFENTKLEEKVEKLEEKIEKLQKKVEKLQALNKRLVEKKEKMEMKMGFALAIAALLCRETEKEDNGRQQLAQHFIVKTQLHNSTISLSTKLN